MKRFISERGQSLVELGVSLVILLYLLSGAAEFGVLFFQFVQLRDAAQEGALYGSMNPSDTTGITARVQAASSSPLDLTTITPVITYSGAQCEGNGITVTLTYDHHLFMPFMPQLLGRDHITLSANVTDTILTPLCP